MENEILVIFKEPGKPAELRKIQNTLESLQDAVGGPIEVLRFAEGCAVIVNKEGKMLGMDENGVFCGKELWGNALFVGIFGDEFCGLSSNSERLLLKSLNKTVLDEWRECVCRTIKTLWHRGKTGRGSKPIT